MLLMFIIFHSIFLFVRFICQPLSSEWVSVADYSQYAFRFDWFHWLIEITPSYCCDSFSSKLYRSCVGTHFSRAMPNENGAPSIHFKVNLNTFYTVCFASITFAIWKLNQSLASFIRYFVPLFFPSALWCCCCWYSVVGYK